MIAPGTLLAGKYRVDRVLGQGGMGVVLAATHVQLGQQVAIKLLLPELVHVQAIHERFVREARASARLRGEHVCRVTDVGALETGEPFIVMELLHGRDLSSVLQSTGPMPVPAAVDILLQACLGLAEAHVLGIVHRDLKPANLFLTQRTDGSECVKVLDFGIAKAQEDQQFALTQTAAVMGSPGYMSPEQMRSSKQVDARTDIWSLGVILFECVAGRPPFTAGSITELAITIATEPTPSIGAYGPPGFDAVLSRTMEKDVTRRYSSVAEFARAIAPFGGPTAHAMAEGVNRVLGGVRAPTTNTIVKSSAPTTLGSAASAISMTSAGKSRKGLIAGIAAIVVAGSVAAIVLTQGGTKTGAPAGANAVAAPDVPTPPPDAAPVSATVAPVDAAPAEVIVDAAVAEVAVDAAVPVASEPVKKHGKATKKSPGTKKSDKSEDLGESSY